MPSTILTESEHGKSTDDGEVVLLDQNGKLTVEAETMLDFLLHADFSALAECELAKPYITEMEVDGETLQVMEMDVAMALIDTDDLMEMFLTHLDTLGDETLEEKAVLATWADFFGGVEAELSEDEVAELDDDCFAEDVQVMLKAIDENEGLDEASKAKSKAAAKKAAQKAGKLTTGATNKKGKIKKGGLKKLAKSADPSKRNTAVRMFLAMREKGIADEKDGKVVINKSVSKKGGTKAGKAKVAKYKKGAGVGESVLVGHSEPLNGMSHAVALKTMDEDATKAFKDAYKAPEVENDEDENVDESAKPSHGYLSESDLTGAVVGNMKGKPLVESDDK